MKLSNPDGVSGRRHIVAVDNYKVKPLKMTIIECEAIEDSVIKDEP
jgi:hypothetical protein